MSQLNKESWSIGRVTGACAACGVAMKPGRVCWATLNEVRAGVGGEAGDVPPTAEENKPVEPAKADGGKVEAPAVRSPFERVDFCEACWGAGKRPAEGREMFSYWKTTVPEPTAKKKLLVDDSVLVDLFGRLEDKKEPQDVRFRFVLALILMRKRLLRYEGSTPLEAGQTGEHVPEIWDMVPRGGEGHVQVINPQLTADQISEVSMQLSQILAEEI